MLEIIVPTQEAFDEETNRFVYYPEVKLNLEHSLISISKWEGTWKIPWFTVNDKTREQTVDYVRCMTLNKGVPSDVYQRIPDTTLNKIIEYINDSPTATVISRKEKGKQRRKQITAEIIYYWMTVFNIPPEYQKWHINRLLALIEVASIESQPQKKMSKQETSQMYKDLNAMRRAKYNTKG